MKSLERYQALNTIIERLSHFSGFNPFAPTWKFDRHRNAYMFLIFLGAVSTVYSMCVAETGVDVIKRSLGIGIFTQTVAKGFLLIANASVYQQLIADIETLYRSKERSTMDVMEKTVGNAEKIYKIITVINSSAVTLFCLYPVVAIFFLEEPSLMFPFFLPLLDPHDYPGFIVNSLIQSILIIYTLLFHNAFDIAFACFTLHAVAIVDLIELDLDELGEFAEKCKTESDVDMKYVRRELKGIIEAQEKFDRYVEKINKFYAWPCFVTSSTSTFSICISLVLVIIVHWPLAYALSWALFGQIFAAYINGELVSLQYERMNQLVYAFPWYRLNVSEQKTMALMLHKSQRPQSMMILFTGPLNMETFTIICNAIYSYFNVCQTLLENEQ